MKQVLDAVCGFCHYFVVRMHRKYLLLKRCQRRIARRPLIGLSIERNGSEELSAGAHISSLPLGVKAYKNKADGRQLVKAAAAAFILLEGHNV